MIDYNTVGYWGNSAVEVDMFYAAEDPFSVTFAFYQPDGEVRWVFDRSLLRDCLDAGKSGQGDIRFYASGNKIRMVFGPSEDEIVKINFLREVIEDFVSDVYDEVPEGEDGLLITDEAIEKWLSEVQ